MISYPFKDQVPITEKKNMLIDFLRFEFSVSNFDNFFSP